MKNSGRPIKYDDFGFMKQNNMMWYKSRADVVEWLEDCDMFTEAMELSYGYTSSEYSIGWHLNEKGIEFLRKQVYEVIVK